MLRPLLLVLVVALAPPARGQIRALAPPEPEAGDYFGAAVALGGDRALVGATGDGACGPNAGAAYVFEPDSTGALAVAARLAPDDCAPGDFFGRAVALSGDYALVASGGEVIDPHRPNAAYLFARDSTGWHEAAAFSGEGAFAAAIALDGDRAVVTAAHDPPGGLAFVYEPDAEGRWREVARLTADAGTARFGTHADLDGDRALITASPVNERGTGAVFVFERTADGRWREAARLGGVRSPAVHAALDGDRLLVGEPGAGPERSGEAAFYHRSRAGRWRRVATLVPSVPYRDGGFGRAVTLDGGRALVVGYSEQIGRETNIDRVVYAFAYTPEAGWVQRQVFDVGAWAFGAAVTHAGRRALVGHTSDDAPGAAYLVDLL